MKSNKRILRAPLLLFSCVTACFGTSPVVPPRKSSSNGGAYRNFAVEARELSAKDYRSLPYWATVPCINRYKTVITARVRYSEVPCARESIFPVIGETSGALRVVVRGPTAMLAVWIARSDAKRVVRRRVRLSQLPNGDRGERAGVWLDGGAQVHIASTSRIHKNRLVVELVSAHLVVKGEIPAVELNEVWETNKPTETSLVRTMLAAGTAVRASVAADAPTIAVVSNRIGANLLSEDGDWAFVEVKVDGATVKGFVDRAACRDTSTAGSVLTRNGAVRQSYSPSSIPASDSPSSIPGTAHGLVPERSCLFGALDAEIVGVVTAASLLPVTYFPIHGNWWLTDVQTEIGPIRVMLRDIANARTPDAAQWELCSK